ncbi:hypothetical protein K440DRAFT_643628 [Wilcoxina mikolae CBS 423.85]|nr:hypothetical protein K440DRAFT_643628 [Wilcoxina mikolae CBS 423.85]
MSDPAPVLGSPIRFGSPVRGSVIGMPLHRPNPDSSVRASNPIRRSSMIGPIRRKRKNEGQFEDNHPRIDPSNRQSLKPDWDVFLPRVIVDQMVHANSIKEWTCYLRVLVPVLYFKIRIIPEEWIPSIIATVNYNTLENNTEAAEMLRIFRTVNQELSEIIIQGHKSEKTKIKQIQVETEKNRDSYKEVIRTFPDRWSIKRHIALGYTDLVQLWTPLIATMEYIYDTTSTAQSHSQTMWLDALEVASYEIIAGFASRLTSGAYTESAMVDDVLDTSLPDTEMEWPKLADEFTMSWEWEQMRSKWPTIEELYDLDELKLCQPSCSDALAIGLPEKNL